MCVSLNGSADCGRVYLSYWNDFNFGNRSDDGLSPWTVCASSLSTKSPLM